MRDTVVVIPIAGRLTSHKIEHLINQIFQVNVYCNFCQDSRYLLPKVQAFGNVPVLSIFKEVILKLSQLTTLTF
jgi:hypothetical protein